MTQHTNDINTICLVCEGDRACHTLTLNGHDVCTCRICSFTFVSPTPTLADLAQVYGQAYAMAFEHYAQNVAHNESRIADLACWVPERGYLLESSASYRHSMATAQACGWRVAGVELSPTAAQHAHEHVGLSATTPDLRDAHFTEYFDAAIMWHVLENTHNPVEQFEHIHTLLHPEGVLANGTAPSNLADSPPDLTQLPSTWMSMRQRAQPTTEWMANVTRKPIEALNHAGWGDELLCYAKRLS